jgi:hypothetical protein
MAGLDPAIHVLFKDEDAFQKKASEVGPRRLPALQAA